ncbi:chemotaxis protein [Oceanospirillum sediminis]|uniref:Chemotaxis protein CheV n=1 Tax=Oceanospirillum sediminis TaxID=2760088 RepID=A0A839ILM5_9GAMM|nr:chemotaxis protein [Oceanospirillum sediminis]MBB1485604.1 chemotaxis protein CheV [Oceanospirillum sediminis]
MNQQAGRLAERAQLVGGNRMELLLFHLKGRQSYGINVFKVKEILPCPVLNSLPQHNPIVRGVANIRGETISVIDLSQAIGMGALPDTRENVVIVTEYNRVTQGFLVSKVDKIVNLNWKDVHPPPPATGKDNYLTAVTELNNTMIEIIDVEKVISEVHPVNERISKGVVDDTLKLVASTYNVVVVDDSSVARNQVIRCLEEVGVQTIGLENGKEVLTFLEALVESGKDVNDEILMIISDIEMPEMDGYTLTTELRAHPELNQLDILLHTSLSGIFNEAMVKRVGADDFLAKYDADELARKVVNRIKAIEDQHIEPV